MQAYDDICKYIKMLDHHDKIILICEWWEGRVGWGRWTWTWFYVALDKLTTETYKLKLTILCAYWTNKYKHKGLNAGPISVTFFWMKM